MRVEVFEISTPFAYKFGEQPIFSYDSYHAHNNLGCTLSTGQFICFPADSLIDDHATFPEVRDEILHDQYK